MDYNLRNFKYFIFDFDGTLVDSKLPWQKLKNDLIILGIKYGLNLEKLTISNMLYAFQTVSAKNIALKIILDFELAHIDDFSLKKSSKKQINMFVNGGIKIAIYSDNFKQTIYNILKRDNLFASIDIIIGREEVELYKPLPEGILKLVNYWKCSTTKMVYIGNSTNDEQAARVTNIQYYSYSELSKIVQ